VPVPGLDDLLGPEGFPHASSTSVEPGDPGRYHALFGRDALITALQVLPERPDVARATLHALAARQGTKDDPVTDEEPGKVPHEVWAERPDHLPAEWPNPYYGTADATSLFLHVASLTGDPTTAGAAAAGAGASDDGARGWEQAGAWLLGALERGGGLVRYGPRRAPSGLAQQGWRDVTEEETARTAGSGIVRPDGTFPAAPVADADVQAAAVAGLRALHRLSGEDAHAEALDALVARVTDAFGDGETIALEADGTKVPGAGSHLGWLLWAGIRTDAIVDRLTRPDVLTAHGLRTLSDAHPQFRPDAYHRGSVWPFDSWLGWGGLRAAGAGAEAERVRTGVLAALDALGRFPELYAVHADGPRAIPASNRVQAWTVGARFALEAGWDGGAHAAVPGSG
jgi:glycogen debranching enzyme